MLRYIIIIFLFVCRGAYSDVILVKTPVNAFGIEVVPHMGIVIIDERSCEATYFDFDDKGVYKSQTIGLKFLPNGHPTELSMKEIFLSLIRDKGDVRVAECVYVETDYSAQMLEEANRLYSMGPAEQPKYNLITCNCARFVYDLVKLDPTLNLHFPVLGGMYPNFQLYDAHLNALVNLFSSSEKPLFLWFKYKVKSSSAGTDVEITINQKFYNNQRAVALSNLPLVCKFLSCNEFNLVFLPGEYALEWNAIEDATIEDYKLFKTVNGNDWIPVDILNPDWPAYQEEDKVRYPIKDMGLAYYIVKIKNLQSKPVTCDRYVARTPIDGPAKFQIMNSEDHFSFNNEICSYRGDFLFEDIDYCNEAKYPPLYFCNPNIKHKKILPVDDPERNYVNPIFDDLCAVYGSNCVKDGQLSCEAVASWYSTYIPIRGKCAGLAWASLFGFHKVPSYCNLFPYMCEQRNKQVRHSKDSDDAIRHLQVLSMVNSRLSPGTANSFIHSHNDISSIVRNLKRIMASLINDPVLATIVISNTVQGVGHAVVPMSLQVFQYANDPVLNPSKYDYKIEVYDSNYPGRKKEIFLSTSTNKFSFPYEGIEWDQISIEEILQLKKDVYCTMDYPIIPPDEDIKQLICNLAPSNPVTHPFTRNKESTFVDSKDFTFNVSPNPGNGLFTINIPEVEEGVINVKVKDAMGKVLYQKEISHSINSLIHLNGFKDGLYIVEVQGEGFYFIEKVIVEGS